ncbi:MAG TPA: hypothetical protein VM936_12595 [Pyrinomonadaceae bacterium]|nr:hypothetical protein [Pyrinomonadaceae bacterium]
MSAHLTEKDLERFRARTLPPDGLLTADEHLSACAACRRRLADAADLRGMFSALRGELAGDAAAVEHLAYEQSEAYVEGALRGAALEAIELHLAACRVCSDEVRELSELRETLNAAPLKQAATPEIVNAARADAHESVAVETPDTPANNGHKFQTRVSRPRRGLRDALAAFRERHLNFSPRWAAAAAAVLLLASLSAWWLASTRSPASPDEIARQSQANSQRQANSQTQSQSNSQTQSQSNSRQPPSEAPAVAPPYATPTPSLPAAPNPTAEQVGLQARPSNPAAPGRNADAEVQELASVPTRYREAVRRALKTNALTGPDVLAEVRSAPRTLMGRNDARAADTFALESPAGVVSRSDRPAFRWRPLRDAEGYTVKVYDADFRLVASSPRLSAAEWTPDKPLARGRVYAWQVAAKRNGEEVVAPAAPAPEARFRVLSRALDEELTRAERDARASRLALGVLYARAGLLEDAERELDAHLRANPRSAAARKLLRSLKKAKAEARP